jgi:DNA helicase-2/ATP-dependent DNA helicase PcrA
MAEKMNEIDQILAYISQGHNFLLSGGAGSGKTYSLVEVVKKIFELNPKSRVACITFTNVAVNQINERVQYENLRVSTIHDFLWDNIKSFQKNLKKSIVELLGKENGIQYLGDLELNEEYFKDIEEIEYREWKILEKGVISHDEVISVAEYMFANFPLLADILKDKYDFILIDEYQDTFPEVIKIFLEYLPKSSKKNIIGFFGDSMQSIFEDGVGNIKAYIDNKIVYEVIKQDNRRNPKVVIDLANKLRTDNLNQEPANDKDAPNYEKEGKIQFLYSQTEDVDIDNIKKMAYFSAWNFKDSEKTKELYLTENLIAPKAGFPTLMKIYDKDPILKLKGDILDKIKDNLQKNKPAIEINNNDTFDEVVDKFDLKNRQRESKKSIITNNPNENSLYEQLKNLPFSFVRNINIKKSQLIGRKKAKESAEEKKGSERDKLISHLFHIQECVYLYESKKYNEFIRKTNFKINSVTDKKRLSEIIFKLQTMREETIEEVIKFAHSEGIWKKDDNFNEFVSNNEYLYNQVKEVKYQELYNLYDYVEGKTPFSTQHNIKGAEFDNVFVILDNGNWNDYNFEYLFGDKDIIYSKLNKQKRESFPNILERSQKIFYVCCTRAKENLIVFYHKPSEEVIEKAKEWFGDKNVHSL